MAAARCLRLSGRGARALVEPPTARRSGAGPAAEGSLRHFSENAALQEKSSKLEVAEEDIVIPRKKTWDKLAVLRALASTVKKDPTAAKYIFQDDPFLIPKNASAFRLYKLSKESGENAARYIVNKHPGFFQRDIAVPHIPCLMPPSTKLQLNEEVSEEALLSLIQLRKVKASVNMYDQLLQKGATISLETSNSLLDLLCFYGDREPSEEENYAVENTESEEQQDALEENEQKGSSWNTPNGIQWREKNNAERIFNLMPEKNAHSYCTMIRGMTKHRACEKAFGMYTELLNNGFNADVHTFNALIVSVHDVKKTYTERWEAVEELLRQMKQQNVRPNLLTFNSVLQALKVCGSLGRSMALRTINEMKILNIEPSLATYTYLLQIFYRRAAFTSEPPDIIYPIFDEMEGKSFYPRDPEDGRFFITAMEICLKLKDVQLAYQLNRIMETGENRKMMTSHSEKPYWVMFFHLLCSMEQLDVIMKYYKELIPSEFYMNTGVLRSLLQALDTADRLDLIPQIWKDHQHTWQFQHSIPAEDILTLMARDVQPPETQIVLADFAADIKSLYDKRQESKQAPLEWTAPVLNHITVLFARAGRAQMAWNMLELFKKHNRIPSDLALNEVLNCIKQENRADQALDLVNLAASFSLPSTPDLAKRVLEEFKFSEESRKFLTDMAESYNE